VCVLEYMHSTRLWIMCGFALRCVFSDSVGIYIHIIGMFGKCLIGMGYDSVLHLQHRHVFRRFHMKCMLAIL
jgi:hypothetical protein